jgi:superfamily II DNA or RNA helicase
MTFDLRPYQTGAIESLRASYRSGNKRVMLYSSTGSGKTEIAMAMIKAAIVKGKRVLFIINRVELINQTSRRFFRSKIAHGIIQGKNTRMTDSNVMVCSIQTLAKRGYPEADFIVIDEAHFCAGSKAYIALIEHYKDVPISALSATPFSKGLGKAYPWGKLFEDLVVATTIRELIDAGYLVDVDIYAPSKPDLSKVRTTAGDYNEKDLGEACDKPVLIGSIVDHWLKIAQGKPTVCFAVNIAHSKHIVEQFKAIGVAAEHIDCYSTEDERKEILERVLSGQTNIISNVGILSTGWDFPACEVMILARPTKSLILWIQMAGRILRPFDGKVKALLLDHSGTTERLGFPTDDLPLMLDDGKPKQSTGSDPKKEKLPEPCVKCSFMKTVHKCPVCGFAPEKQNTVETEDGELTILTKKGQAKAAKLAGLDKQTIYSELLSIKNARGYSDGWVSHQYRDVFGVWPSGMQSICKEPGPQILNIIKAKMIRYSKGKAKAQAAA